MSRSEKSASTGRGGWAWTDPIAYAAMLLAFVVALLAVAPFLYRLAEIAVR